MRLSHPRPATAPAARIFQGRLIGRFAGGARKKADQLAAELEEKREEAERYRKEVDAHFDKTATLFVSMAGSYKELFEHLSSGYDKLSDKSARDVFRERIDAMLVGSSLEHKMIGEAPPTAAEAATDVQEATAEAGQGSAVGEDAVAEQGAPAMPDGEPMVGAEPVKSGGDAGKPA